MFHDPLDDPDPPEDPRHIARQVDALAERLRLKRPSTAPVPAPALSEEPYDYEIVSDGLGSLSAVFG